MQSGWTHPGLDYPREGQVLPSGQVHGIDRAFGMHAAASLTWVVLGYISVVHSRRISGRFHKVLGYISLLSFLAHLACSIFNLYTDVVRHTPLPKLMLLYSAISSLGSMSRSIAAAIRRRPGWKLTHQDDMVTCYMDSIQGAGPIRMIAHVQGWMACGAVHCQWQYGGVATHCLWPYVFRLLCIATWTRYTNGLYVKMRGDEQLTRKYMRSCVKLAVLSGLVVAFSFVPHSEWILRVMLGGERSYQGAATVLLGALALLKIETDRLRAVFAAPSCAE